MDQHDSQRVRFVAGCMTGTSLDGLDAALVKIEGSGLEMKATFLGLVSKSLGPLADQLRHFAEGRAAVPLDYMKAARRLGELHAEAIAELCNNNLQSPPTPVGGSVPRLDFVVAHGQTIWHAPAERLSWQLFDPWPIVRALKVPVCYDLRQADLIAGGQGAPITPIADWVMYGSGGGIVNLGGICNITDTVGEIHDIEGGDIYPCNILIDGVVRLLFSPLQFDRDGAIAASGHVIPSLVDAIQESIRTALCGKASLGREDFGEAWLRRLVSENSEGIDARDFVASAVEVVAQGIAFHAQAAGLQELALAGGGTRNPVLVERIRKNCGHTSPELIVLSDDLGIPSEAREAMAFAVLGALSQDGVPITLPQVTGADKPGRAGAWVYP